MKERIKVSCSKSLRIKFRKHLEIHDFRNLHPFLFLQRLARVSICRDAKTDHNVIMLVTTRKATSPCECDLGAFCIAFDVEFNTIDEHPCNLLSILRRGGWRIPEHGNVLRQLPHECPLLIIQL